MISKWNYDQDFERAVNELRIDCQRFEGKAVLITGATGLIGTCLTEFFLYLKLTLGVRLELAITARTVAGAEERFHEFLISGDLRLFVHDIRDSLPKGLKFDFIVHAASVANPQLYASAPVDTIKTTITGTENLLELARETGARMAYISTVEVYGETSAITDKIEEHQFGYLNCFQVRSSYPESKRLAETLCCAYASQYKTDTVVLRLCKVYGPSNSRTDTRAMAYVLNLASRQEDVVLESDGLRVFSFCYVTDAISAIVVALLDGRSGEAYNVADDASIYNLRDVVTATAALAGVSAKFGSSVADAAVSRDAVMCNDKLVKLGWKPLINMPSGLRKQFEAIVYSAGSNG